MVGYFSYCDWAVGPKSGGLWFGFEELRKTVMIRRQTPASPIRLIAVCASPPTSLRTEQVWSWTRVLLRTSDDGRSVRDPVGKKKKEKEKKEDKVHPFTGTEALYRPYDP